MLGRGFPFQTRSFDFVDAQAGVLLAVPYLLAESYFCLEFVDDDFIAALRSFGSSGDFGALDVGFAECGFAVVVTDCEYLVELDDFTLGGVITINVYDLTGGYPVLLACNFNNSVNVSTLHKQLIISRYENERQECDFEA